MGRKTEKGNEISVIYHPNLAQKCYAALILRLRCGEVCCVGGNFNESSNYTVDVDNARKRKEKSIGKF
jgi:hypothetical protein